MLKELNSIFDSVKVFQHFGEGERIPWVLNLGAADRQRERGADSDILRGGADCFAVGFKLSDILYPMVFGTRLE